MYAKCCRKILSTIAFWIFEFTKFFPKAAIGISPVDERRGMLYNYVFQKYQEEIEVYFNILGFNGIELEPYNSSLKHGAFVIHRKNN